MAIGQEDIRHLDEGGFVILEDFIDPALREALRRRIEELFVEEGDGAGAEFKLEPGCRRLANLVNKGEVFRQAIVMPRLLEYVRRVLGPEIKLSSLNARSLDPYSTQHQPLHADMGAVADERGYWVCNTVWILDDFTADNGALRAVPGSHRWGKLPQDALADPLAPHPQQVLLTGKAGTLIVMNAHLWHAGTANRTSRPRTAMHAFYCRHDKPQQQYQKQLLDSALQQSLSPPLRELLALDDPLNDQLSSQVATRSGFLK